MEIDLKFVVNGVEIGGSTISVEKGQVNTNAAEDEFYAVLRKNEKRWIKEAEEEERSLLVENLEASQEEKLKEAHAKQYAGLDDEMSDDYEEWLTDLSLNELKELLK